MDDDNDGLEAFRLPTDDEDPAGVADLVLRMPEHLALRENDVSFGYLMRCETKHKAGKVELGSVHVVKYMAQGGFKDLFFQLLDGMLGHLPDFLVVLDVEFWAAASPMQRQALMFHELKHVQQKTDRNGDLKFDMDGNPVFHCVEHDITAFNDEVARYGAWNAGIREFLAAAERV